MNGLIFRETNIEFKFVHNKGGLDPEIQFNLRKGEFHDLELEFLEHLRQLNTYRILPASMWALTCRVFGIELPSSPTRKQSQLFEMKHQHVKSLTKQYFANDGIGQNGYAALNVLSDFASRPVGYLSAENQILKFQRISGQWVREFVSSIRKPDFDFVDYLGKYAMMRA